MCGPLSLVEKWLNQPYTALRKVGLADDMERFNVQHTDLTLVHLFNLLP